MEIYVWFIFQRRQILSNLHSLTDWDWGVTAIGNKGRSSGSSPKGWFFAIILSDHRQQRITEWQNHPLKLPNPLCFHRRLILKLMRFVLFSCQCCFLYCALINWALLEKPISSGRIQLTTIGGRRLGLVAVDYTHQSPATATLNFPVET